MGDAENKIQKQVLADVRKLNLAYVWRQNQITVRGRKFTGVAGLPDIIGFLPDGRFLGIEIKTPDGRQSNDQKEFQTQCKKWNAVYIIGHDPYEIVKEIIRSATPGNH